MFQSTRKIGVQYPGVWGKIKILSNKPERGSAQLSLRAVRKMAAAITFGRPGWVHSNGRRVPAFAAICQEAQCDLYPF